jgi:hypothetical protein
MGATCTMGTFTPNPNGAQGQVYADGTWSTDAAANERLICVTFCADQVGANPPNLKCFSTQMTGASGNSGTWKVTATGLGSGNTWKCYGQTNYYDANNMTKFVVSDSQTSVIN